MKLKRLGLSLVAYGLFFFSNCILADEKDAYYWSGSIAAVCNLYEDGQVSAIDAKAYLKKLFIIIDKMPNKYSEMNYDFFNVINDGSCKKLAP